jgi:hypothetical protein
MKLLIVQLPPFIQTIYIIILLYELFPAVKVGNKVPMNFSHRKTDS